MIIPDLKNIETKISTFTSLIVGMAFVYTNYISNNPLSVYIQNQSVHSEGIDALYDFDKELLNKYNVSMFHSGKNDEGEYKFSYIKVDNRYFRAWKDPVSESWVYEDGGSVYSIKNLMER